MNTPVSLIQLLDKHIAMPVDDDHQRGWRRACEFIKDKIISGQLSSEIPVVDEPAEILKAIADYKAQWKKVGVVIDENDVNSFVGGWTARAEAFPPKPVSSESIMQGQSVRLSSHAAGAERPDNAGLTPEPLHATQQPVGCPGDKARKDNVGKNTPPNVIYETFGGDKNPAAAALVSSILWNLAANGWGFVNESDTKRESVAPTEEMCQRARGFIMGLDLVHRTWGAMQHHLDAGGYPTTYFIKDKANKDPSGHITKWDVAECIYRLVEGIGLYPDIPRRG